MQRHPDLIQSLEEPGAGPNVGDSQLANALLFLVAWGLIHSETAAWIARCAKEDGLDHPEISKLATCGNSGRCPQNSRRDLLNRFFKQSLFPEPLQMRLPCLDKGKHVHPRVYFHYVSFQFDSQPVDKLSRCVRFNHGVQPRRFLG